MSLSDHFASQGTLAQPFTPVNLANWGPPDPTGLLWTIDPPLADFRHGVIRLVLESGIAMSDECLLAVFSDGSVGVSGTGGVEGIINEFDISVDDMELLGEAVFNEAGGLQRTGQPLPDTAHTLTQVAVGVSPDAALNHGVGFTVYDLRFEAGGGVSEFWTAFRGCKELAR